MKLSARRARLSNWHHNLWRRLASRPVAARKHESTAAAPNELELFVLGMVFAATDRIDVDDYRWPFERWAEFWDAMKDWPPTSEWHNGWRIGWSDWTEAGQ